MIRLSLIAFLFALVQIQNIEAPARFTTRSCPATLSCQDPLTVGSPTRNLIPAPVALLRLERDRIVTVWPSSTSPAANALPTKPEPPAINTFMATPQSFAPENKTLRVCVQEKINAYNNIFAIYIKSIFMPTIFAGGTQPNSQDECKKQRRQSGSRGPEDAFQHKHFFKN